VAIAQSNIHQLQDLIEYQSFKIKATTAESRSRGEWLRNSMVFPVITSVQTAIFLGKD
jgi:hypothetical protein